MLIPSMGGDKIARELETYAASADKAIVEVGAWLGAGTVHLARGARHPGQVQVFDRWKANESEVGKLEKAGVNVEVGQDLRPLFLNNLGADREYVVCHKCMIHEIEWDGDAVSLYVDDASKRKHDWLHVMETFEPCFIPGETHLILMDYYWPSAKVQRQWMKDHAEYEHVADIGDANIAMFRFIGC